MRLKTDNPALVGVHKFEAAGLGKGPFRYVGIRENHFTYPGGSKPGGSCDYCGTGILYECWVRSADGREFKVGTDCILKVGDTGLLKAYKTSPWKREHDRKLRRERGLIAKAEVEAFLKDHKEMLSAKPHPMRFNHWDTGKPMSLWDYFSFVAGSCGLTGMTRLAKRIRKEIA